MMILYMKKFKINSLTSFPIRNKVMREIVDKVVLATKNETSTDIRGSIANSVITTFISIKLISCFIVLNAYLTGK